MSLKFMTPGHTQNPPVESGVQRMNPPSPGDLPPEFLEETKSKPQGGATIPPPPSQPPQMPTMNPPPAITGSPSVEPPVATPPGAEGVLPVESSAPVIPQFASDDQYTYDPTGRRDPFKPYRNYRPPPPSGPLILADDSDPLQRWDLDRFNVVAIMWEVRHPKAMVKDPDGRMYMIGKSTKIGRNAGFVATIREGEVVVVESIENEGVLTKEVKILELKK